MQSAENYCSPTFAKSLPTTYYFSITIYQSDRYKKVSYPNAKIHIFNQARFAGRKILRIFATWQRETNYIKGTGITDSTIFQD